MAFTKKGASRRAAELFAASDPGKKQHSNIVLRIMRGELSLTVTFWICCISIPLVGHLLFSRVLFPIMDVHTWYGSSTFIIWAALSVLYAAVVCTGLWRSRKNYTGSRTIAELAGLFAVAGAAGAVAYAVMILTSWHMLLNL